MMIYDVPLAKENSAVLEECDGLLCNFSVAGNSLPLSAKPRQAHAGQSIPHDCGC